ncbi:MAG: peptidoglycan-associated lipoprotein Pal [Sideroxyarcus sp.]|nr:peptidoglycan-associated lipoprotein Pal [Sideroxyarcus sp.]
MHPSFLITSAVFAIAISGCASTPSPDANSVSAPPKAVSGANTAPVAAPPPTSIDPRQQAGSVLAKRSIYFDYDSYAVKPEYQDIVAAHAKFLSSRKDLKVMLEGHADERGSREYNLALGQRRSEAVFKVITMTGGLKDNLEAVSFGKEKPVAIGHDESAWKQNRRVDIRYSDDKARK